MKVDVYSSTNVVPKEGSVNNPQLEVYRIGLESMIAHAICQQLNYDDQAGVEQVIEEYRTLFEESGMPEYLIHSILENGHKQGILEATMFGIATTVNSAAQIKPSANPMVYQAITKLIHTHTTI